MPAASFPPPRRDLLPFPGSKGSKIVVNVTYAFPCTSSGATTEDLLSLLVSVLINIVDLLTSTNSFVSVVTD